MRFVADWHAALGLLTRIPVGRRISDRPGAAAFAAVGALVGAVAAVPFLALAGPAHEPLLGALAAVALTVVVTGAMHLDGVADTADALLAPNAAAAERARKDPAVGPGGLVAIVLVVGGEVAALTSIVTSADAGTAAWTIVAAGGAARSVPVFLAALSGSDRAEGLGSWFKEHVTTSDAVMNVVIVALLLAGLGALAGPPVGAAATGGLVVGLALGWVIIARRGSPDGDALGASVEIAYLASLAAVALVT